MGPGGLPLGTTTLFGQVVDDTNGNPAPGVDASVCEFGDTNCLSPLAQGSSDSNGNLALQVSPKTILGALGPDTYVQVSSPSIVPALYFLGYSPSAPVAPVAQPYIVVATPAEVQSGGGLLPPGPTWDAGGWIGFEVLDCDGIGAAGVQVTAESAGPTAMTYYFQGSVGSFTATETGFPTLGGIVNVSPGIVTLTATPLALGRPSSTGHVLVRPGTLSVLFMYPSSGSAAGDP
jgi:hypothetical protein